MRILRAIRTVNPETGGPIEALVQSSKILTQKGHTVEVVSIDAPQDACFRSFPLKIHTVGPGKGQYGFTFSFAKWLNENVTKYDCVIVEGLWQFHGYSIRKSCQKHGVPYFVFIHGMLNPWSKKEYPTKHLKKWLYWLLVEYKVLKDANAVFFTNEEERNVARNIFWPNKYNEIIVKLGTRKPPSDFNRYKEMFFKVYPEIENKRCLLFLSRIHPKKGCDLLIEAFAQIKNQDDNLHLVMVGPDQVGWKRELEKNAKSLGVDRHITWIEMLTGDLKWGAYYSADAFILPSHYENFGIVVVEALGCGLPVLITNKINIWREIEFDDAGLIEEDTIEGTKNLINRYVALSVEKRNIIANNAKVCFHNRFEIENATESLLQEITLNIDSINMTQ